MTGTTKPRLMCYRCQREFFERTGSSFKNGLFKCAPCVQKETK